MFETTEIPLDTSKRDNGTSTANESKNKSENIGISSRVSNLIGDFFNRLGYTVAIHPWNTIIVCLLLVCAFSVGFMNFHNEKNPLKLWIPKNSKFLRDTDWLMNGFEEAYRMQSVLITAPNVLDPAVMFKMAQINEEIIKLSVKLTNGSIAHWRDLCFKIPIVTNSPKIPETSKRKRDTDGISNSYDFDDNIFDDLFDDIKDEDKILQDKDLNRKFNPSVDLDPAIYCNVIDNLPKGCYQLNLLELWKYDLNLINNLVLEDVITALNKTTVSPYTGHETNFTDMLGGVERHQVTGEIIGATSIISHWMLYVNFSAVDHEKIGNLAGTEDWASEEAMLWENEFLNLMERLKIEYDGDGVEIFYSAGRSYGDISAATMFQDYDKLIIGGVLMFIYMQIVLSKFNWVELRFTLGSMGLFCVGMAFLSTCGICSVLSVSYGPVHTSLPFLLMGLGVDDIFVMMACYRKVQASHKDLPIAESMGLMLKHAGASITVTSLTDIVAFLVGATTVLPSLQSFCIYAAFGVFMTYFYAITFFIAIFTLDERRIAAKRNSIMPCIQHSVKSSERVWCNKNLMHSALTNLYQKVIFTKAGKIIVIMSVICMTGLSMESLFKLEQKFDPFWFIPERTYLNKYITKVRKFYPQIGYEAGVYTGKLNYTEDLPNIVTIVDAMENRTDIIHSISTWTHSFNDFTNTYYGKDIKKDKFTDLEMRTWLSKFLFSPNGGKYQANFRFETKLKCGQPTSSILIQTIPFKFRKFQSRNIYLPAMYDIEHIVENANLTSGDGFSTVWGRVFSNWITDEIIDAEVMRNISLALACVMLCTGVLIFNLHICFWIFICVLLTLVNVCGFMQRWGLTIDLVSCIGLQLAVGLCVDYAAHIGHTFLTVSQGTKTERALETILHIGAAVLYGGGSTLLALSMLSGSEAYTFQAFFKIFLLVILFGLFHGIVFFPVILSLIGPAPYKQKASHINKNKSKIFTSSNKNDYELVALDSSGVQMLSQEPKEYYSTDLKAVDDIEELKTPT